MLEHEGQLITWALPAFPEPDAVVVAIRLPDHRLAYLDYEGPVSRDRGHVRRVEEGSYAVCRGDWESLGSAVCSLVELEVRGTRLRGTLQLRQLSIPGATWEIRLLSQSDVA